MTTSSGSSAASRRARVVFPLPVPPATPMMRVLRTMGRRTIFNRRRPMAKTKRTRTDRREAERAQEKLASQREKLFALEAGGSAGHPREVVSASLVEPESRSLRCPRCEGELHVLEHLAVTLDGTRLREA